MKDLVPEWKKRVAEVQEQLRMAKDEIAAIKQQRDALVLERNAFSSDSKEQKLRSQGEMAALEAQTGETTEMMARAQARKAEADRLMQAATTEYNLELVQLMNEVKAAEQSLGAREIPAEALERESDIWCAEEEGLRERMRAIERDIVEQRRAGATALAAAEEEARHAEQELHAARMERNADEGAGPFAFSDAMVAQYPELLMPECECAAVAANANANFGEDGRIRKGRSASGKMIGGASRSAQQSRSRKGSAANSVAALSQRSVNASMPNDAVDEDCA